MPGAMSLLKGVGMPGPISLLGVDMPGPMSLLGMVGYARYTLGTPLEGTSLRRYTPGRYTPVLTSVVTNEVLDTHPTGMLYSVDK